MNNNKLRNGAILSGATLLGAVGQLLFKYSFSQGGLFIAWLAAGLGAYGLATLIYFYVLSRVHLSWAYGIGWLSYIFATIFAYFILAESVPLVRWIGVIVITAGVLFIGLS